MGNGASRWAPIALGLAFLGCPDGSPSSQPEATPAAEPVLVEGAAPHTFATTLPGGAIQQVPDQMLLPPVTSPAQAWREAIEQLDTRDREYDGYVLLAGMGHHGIPLIPESHEIDEVPDGEPALVVTNRATPATTYADCIGALQFCAMRAGTFDGCVAASPICVGDEPWAHRERCCPAGAIDAYEDARAEGIEAPRAYDREFIDGSRYFPGLEEALREEGIVR